MLHSLQTMNWGRGSPIARLNVVCTISFVGALAVRFFWVTSCVEIVIAIESVSVVEADNVLIGVPSLASGVSSLLSFLLLPA